MATHVEEALARASLSARERRVVERTVTALREKIGDDLRAVWLYGSRARGEADPEETDPDRRSDVDLLVIASGDLRRNRRLALDLNEEAALAEGESPFLFSVHVFDPRWLRRRREIESFFIQEVDRDKLVLVGDDLR